MKNKTTFWKNLVANHKKQCEMRLDIAKIAAEIELIDSNVRIRYSGRDVLSPVLDEYYPVIEVFNIAPSNIIKAHEVLVKLNSEFLEKHGVGVSLFTHEYDIPEGKVEFD